jgi:DNA mismatch repair protein MutL
MSDIINVLPDSVANQIAAGEVVQRPASVVKELVENAVDAGTKIITVNIKDGGRSLIQVIDEGKGMSPADARLSIERHATSKIKDAKDLFCIRTMGFRGEALASIAAIADVTIISKQYGDELGTHLNVRGSEVISQEPEACNNGTNILVKNLFFNVPARRKFLKTVTTEFRHIINEFQRIALCHPEISFSLVHNGENVFNLPEAKLRPRIIQMLGKNLNQNLATIETETSIVKIKGYIGKPDIAKKRMGEQYFFINGRYMRHPYFNKAVMKAYEKLLPSGVFPSYFIYFEADPESIDINIHPTKTEIKFENEQAIFQILQASIKEGLGRFNLVPSIDFETSGMINIPAAKKEGNINPPSVIIDPSYNPFKTGTRHSQSTSDQWSLHKENQDNWENMYAGFEIHPEKEIELGFDSDSKEIPEQKENNGHFIQVKGRFILTPVMSGIMLIDQKRAHERVLFESFIQSMAFNKGLSQKSLFPKTIELSADDFSLVMELKDTLAHIGFGIEAFGKNTIVVNSYPADASDIDPQELLDEMLNEYKISEDSKKVNIKEKIAIALAKASAVRYGHKMSTNEMRELFDKLFASEMPNYSPAGKPIIQIINMKELESRF